MRILVYDADESRQGIVGALRALGHQVSSYGPDKPHFDAFDEVEPDLYLCGNLIPLKCLKERPKLKLYDLSTMMPAANIANVGRFDPTMASDVVHVGDYDEEMFERVVLPLSEMGLRLKIFGMGWNIPEAVGMLRPERVQDAYKSSIITLYLGKPTVTESLLNILASGSLCVSVPLADDVVQDGRHFVSPPMDMISDAVELYLKRESEGTRKLITDRAREYVLCNHTYFHRAADIFRSLKLNKELNKTLDYINENIRV